MELAHFTPHIATNDTMKDKKFHRGLRSGIQSCIEILILKYFVDVVETTMVAEKESEDLQKI